MGMRRGVWTVLVAALAVPATAGLTVLPAPAAHAAPAHAALAQAAAKPTVRLSVPGGPPGTTVKVSGSHFKSRDTVTITFDSTRIATARADGKGAFSGVTGTVPATATTGTHPVTASAGGGKRSATTSFVVTGPRALGDWPQILGGPAHQNASTTDTAVTPANVSTLRRSALSEVKDGIGQFVVAAGVAYVTAPSTLIAIDVATGRQLWSRSESALRSRIAVAGNLLVVGGHPTVSALDPATGATVWTSTVVPGVRPPAVGGGLVFLQTDDGTDHGRVFALDAATGATRWTSADRFVLFGTSPAYADGKVFVGTAGEGDVRAYDAATGAPLWRTSVGEGLEKPLIVADGVVYAPGPGNRIHALDEATGALRWSRPVGTRLETQPAVVGGGLYVAAEIPGPLSADGYASYGLYAIDAATGAVRWQVVHDPLVDRNGVVTAALGFSDSIVAAGLVYTDSNGIVTAREAVTGLALWTSAAAFDYSALAIAGGRLLASAGEIDSGGHFHTGLVSFAPA